MKFATFLVIFCWSFALIEIRQILGDKIESTAKKLGLTDINVDCQIIILEQMELESFTNMPFVSEYFATMAVDIFKRVYSNKSFAIVNAATDLTSDFKPIYDVVLGDIELAEKVLRVFGHLIKKLEIDYSYINYEDAKQIEEFLSQYCSKSLIALRFNNFTSNPLATMSKPFANLERVAFNGDADQIINRNYKLNEIFPAIQSMYIQVENIQDRSCLDVEFAHLRTVQVLFSLQGFRQSFQPNDVQRLLMKNPQIRSFSTTFAPFSFLKIVNDLLPQLEDLTIVTVAPNADYHDEIRFRHVKRFTLVASGPIPSNFIFNQLETIVFHNTQPITSSCVKYFGKFPGIKRFEVLLPTTMCTIKPAELKRLAEKLPNLNEVILVADTDITQTNVIDFVRSCKHLKKLHLMYTDNDLTQNFAYEIDEIFDVRIIWDAFAQRGSITIQQKYVD